MKIMHVLLLSLLAQSVFAMEDMANKIPCTRIKKEEIVSLVPGVAEPIDISYLGNGVIAVLDKELSANKLVVYNVCTQKLIMKREKITIDCFAVDASKTKIALCEGKQITVFNAKTGEEEWSKSMDSYGITMAFNPLNNTQ